MRRIAASIYVSLDGVAQAPAWSHSYFSDDAKALAKAQLFACDALLLGRKTYEEFAAAWPKMTDSDGFAERMNGIEKYVVSSTIAEPGWNARRLSGILADSIDALKKTDGGDILIYGSLSLTRSLIARGLLDELRLWIHPIIVGGGARLLFPDGCAPAKFSLASAQTLESGVIVAIYRPA